MATPLNRPSHCLTAVIGVDIVEVEVRRVRKGLSRRRHSVKGDFGFSGEGGDRPAAVADQMIFGRDDAGQRGPDRSAVILRQDGVEGRALSVAATRMGILS